MSSPPQLLLDWIWNVLFRYEDNLIGYFFPVAYEWKLD